ncbi:MAG TPA: nodulation protein NfeD, partial [Thermoanaerobaculia bacterium]|nr:nodulation protein NfeD [Thermoanaerobaculia bacterium]
QGEGEAPAAEALEETSAGPLVVVVAIRSPIHPVSAEILDDAVREAEARNAVALVVELDTPGGLMTSMRSMIQSLFASRVPVVVYVAPPGAQAASAGFFLLMAADVAAMAPGTNAGAAAAVTAEGADIEGTMGEKGEQDARAQIRSLAKRSGRNVELAEAAVTESRSFDADEALEAGLIDIVAPTLADLLQEIDGRTVETAGGEEVVLRTARAVIERVEPTPFQRARGLLAQPNIALLLLSIGSLGLMMELYNPGAIFPGVVGAICLILGFYSLSILPINAAGLLLLGLAVVFFIAEIKVTSYGLLTLAGVISLVLGGLMLFETADPALRVSLEVLATAAILATVVVLFLMFQVLRAHRNRVRTGTEGMVTERGRAWNDLRPEGKVFVHGELWDAVAEAPVAKGERVEVVAVDGMTLRVRGLGQSVSGPTGTPAPAGEA